MKYKQLFLLVFLLPIFIFGLNQEACTKIHNEVTAHWNRHYALIEQHNNLSANEIEKRIQLLKESAECCRKAIGSCDTILHDIAGKSKDKRKEPWRAQMKKVCEEDKNHLHAEVHKIQSAIQNLQGELAWQKAFDLYQKSQEKADQANVTERACQRNLHNVDEVVSVLEKASNLYAEACFLARQALLLVAPDSSRIEQKKDLEKIIENYEKLAQKYKNEANDWPTVALAQKEHLKEKVVALQQESQLFKERGLKRTCYELQKQAVSLLEKLIESSVDEDLPFFAEKKSFLQTEVFLFEQESDAARLTDATPLLSKEEFKSREELRKEMFFKSDLLLTPDLFISKDLKNLFFPRVVALDGQHRKEQGNFILYTDQLYRFLVQDESIAQELWVQVHQNGETVHVEKIFLPFERTQGWEDYLKNGMLFIPDTKLKSDFGLDLRLSFVCDQAKKFSMIIAHKAMDTRYEFSIGLDTKRSLYECSVVPPPPWQLQSLRKPSLVTPNLRSDPSSLPSQFVVLEHNTQNKQGIDAFSFPILDSLVAELKQDPLALASYVHNEIAFSDPHLHQENGVFYPPNIHRDPSATYREKQGSPWEQCQLLVYLLKKAGYRAMYAYGAACKVSKDFAERMLLTHLSDDQSEALLQYPWVVFFDGKQWVSLFPWMKQVQIEEGHDLYSHMPEEYATAHRWILRYLKGDEKILKHIGPDGDDTAGVLFVRFAEEILRERGLSLDDVGVHRRQLKKQFSSWKEFPRPSITEQAQIISSLQEDSPLFAKAKIQVCSHENPNKSISRVISLFRLAQGPSSIHFFSEGKKHYLHLQIAGENTIAPVELDETDHSVDVIIDYEVILGSRLSRAKQTFCLAKGTTAALCAHFGGATSKRSSELYEQFSLENDEQKRVFALLSYVGASYFEKCSRTEKNLARLHKVNPSTAFAIGLSKLSPDLSKGNEDLVLPQVDMFWFHAAFPTVVHPSVWHQEFYTARMQYQSLFTVDSSSNEHQILREVFKDPYAISTVKLLQLAHKQHQKNGLEGEGFLTFTPSTFQSVEQMPEAAQALYFSDLKNLNLRDVKGASPGQWSALKELLDSSNPLSSWSYGYMTPGLIASQDGSYKEMGTLILSPEKQYALISGNNLIQHGGLGSAIPAKYFSSNFVQQSPLPFFINDKNYNLDPPTQTTDALDSPSNFETVSTPASTSYISDVRPWYKSIWSVVSDPIDTVSGAFYIDEVDLILPGPFSLTIRRNYNSQNPLISSLGCGWKLSLNPFLIDQEGKRFASELDGTVIVYSYNQQKGRWEVYPEDNPELGNFSQAAIAAGPSPFHSYIENNILYGADGSRRFYEEGLLQKWVDPRGNTLSFCYENRRLVRVESSNGDFFGIHYNHQQNICEIYAKDGRRISYDYDSNADLIKVTLPNTAQIIYEYDRYHRIIRETKQNGRVIENIYDDQGRVKEQRSPMGLAQQMITTATFEYSNEQTIVTDARGNKTIYKIYDKQIYKIIDPLGFVILQSWFIDKDSWFDAETEQVLKWKHKGGAIKSLKSTTDKRGLTTSYLYDDRGNPILIKLEGEDLTGKGDSVVEKKLSYNERNLCIEEQLCGERTQTIYDLRFPYLPQRIEKYRGTTLISYVELQYNCLGQLEKEDRSGAITIWHYNKQGFPIKKIQLTQTEDPDVVTDYTYNYQGQCIQITCTDAVFEYEYDLMGNQITSKILSTSGDLLSATYTGYDLNNSPIWKQGANPKNIIYFDYHASGAVKAKRQTLAPSRQMAYTLYEYDSCGNLIEETDPRGYVTYRSYDPLGQIKEETKEGHTTCFSYEPGGLVATITSGSGGQVSRYYTTNGLLKEEVYPDGTRNTYVYDFFGRVVLEIKNDVVWQMEYDDANRRVISTHAVTQNHEIQQFDARGNLVKFVDAAGYCSEKTYDGLNRLKSDITPSGKETIWNYQGDCIVCTAASLETTTTRYAAGKAIESEVRDSQGNIIATSQRHFDPQLDKEEIIEGELRTVIWKNSLGLPLRMQKGDITNSYVYDACGNCVQLVDGDGRITYQEFDGLGRLQMRKLPDQNVILYFYDVDSNLSEYHLPNGNVWKACYDSMKRKTSEKLISSAGSCQEWSFYYEDGYLKTATDPMGRTHTYLYDLYGRISEDSVQGGKRVYTYEPRGFLATARQTTNITTSWFSSWVYGSQTETSFVERSYDADGHVAVESIYLNGQLIEQAKQKWTSNSRSLQIDDHIRDFIYQNNQLVGVSTEQISMKYSYGLDGALKSKDSQLACIKIDYNRSGLPQTVFTSLPEGSYKEEFGWYSSGKMRRYRGCGKDNNFSYNEQGYLQSTGSEKYDFDAAGRGVRIEAPGWYVPKNGLDEFGRVLHCIFDNSSLMLAYDNIGQVITYGEKQLSWDPWGKLVKITDPSYSWEASYDPLGRRIQTRYTKSGKATVISNSLYDPEKKFEEIGVQIGQKIFWKIYGPNSCDAVSDETGDTVVLIHNGLRQLTGVISSERGYYQQKLPTVYGDVDFSFSVPSDLISYAQSLNWHSKSQDPTGFMWMGDRYYDSRTGQFLSQDPVSYPMCMDLYAYANGDPVNYFDPDGRFASPVYESKKPFVLGDFVEHKISLRDYNRIPTYLADNNLTRCDFFEQAGFDLPCGAIGFINGINNTREDFMQSIRMLSEYAKGIKVYGIYNATNWDSIRGVSILIDVLECGLNHLGIHTPPVELLKMQWNHFIATHGPDEKFLQFSHSGGALHVYNALMSSPEWVRQRIISVAIAPAAIIPKKLCYKSYNYMSKRDFVTRLDIVGNIKYGDELKILEPHQEADFWDHSFLSPTFKNTIEKNINDYIQVFGGRYEVSF